MTTPSGELSNYLGDISRQPSAGMVVALEADLAAAFAASSAAMHVYTGSSKASGRTTSEKDSLTSSWEGEIFYGGPEIKSAWEWYRKDRAAGGRLPSPHGNFFYILDTLDPMWRATLSCVGA